MLNYDYLNIFKHPTSYIIWLVLLTVFILCNTVHAEEFMCKVKSVHDGDTFTCSDNRKIRVWGIDTPEIPPKVKESTAIKNGGYIARDYLKSKIQDHDLICTKKGKSYKRIVAICTLNGYDIAVQMLKNGYAKEYKKFSKGYYSDGRLK